MPARMIKVRSRLSGDVTLVAEKSYPLFAAYYERLDQPDTPTPDPAQPGTETPVPPAAARPTASRTPRPATTDKE